MYYHNIGHWEKHGWSRFRHGQSNSLGCHGLFLADNSLWRSYFLARWEELVFVS